MKILQISMGRSTAIPRKGFTPRRQQPALELALASLGECKVIHWREVIELHGMVKLHQAIVQTAKTFQPDLTFIQVQRDKVLTPAIIKAIPGRVMNWTGDIREPMPPYLLGLAGAVYTTAFTNLDDVLEMRRLGFRADYLQTGFNEQRFTPKGVLADDVPDVVFLGSNYEPKRRFAGSGERLQMVKALHARYKGRFGVYGRFWPFPYAHDMVREQREAAIYRGCKVAVTHNHFVRRMYTSDRLFRSMGSGAFVLNHRYPDQDIEFREGEHFRSWRTIEELFALVDYYLEHEAQRRKIARQGCAWVHCNATWTARMQDFLYIMGASKVALPTRLALEKLK